VKILDLFGRELGQEWRYFLLVAVISAVSGTFVLATINSAALSSRQNAETAQTILLLGLAIGLFVFTQKTLMVLSAELAERSVDNLRTKLLSSLVSAELLEVERLNRSEIYSCVNSELRIISDGVVNLVIIAQSTVLVLMIMLYLAFLSFIAVIISIAFIAIGATIHLSHTREIIQHYEDLFRLGTKITDGFADLIEGFKEVKLNLGRSRELVEHVTALSTGVREKTLDVRRIFASQFVNSQVAFFVLIAIIVFVLPEFSTATSETITKITMSSLYVVGPITSVIGGLPILQRMNAAADAVISLQNRLDVIAISPPDTGVDVRGFGALTLDAATFQYSTSGGEAGFQIGPLNLEISRGQIVLISGGNGSGKSTLLKLITGLYPPTTGDVLLDRQVIGPESIVAYRNLFSAIFSDYYIFQRLYGISDIDKTTVGHYLNLMGLEGKVSILDRRFDTIALSTGQRKRLAMIVLLLEDRPIYVFDEWAADQDVHMREKFYREILPEFRRARKTVIAVTHDERYFDVCDVHYNMEYGQLQLVPPATLVRPV
jgi:putative ATP-binding cassette transporter